jgi:hypothetical protein
MQAFAEDPGLLPARTTASQTPVRLSRHVKPKKNLEKIRIFRI